MSKQIIEAKTNGEVYLALEELADLYLEENKYNDFIVFLNSLVKQKKTLEPAVNYYIAYSRYRQLKYLEETQGWDEYFSQGNNYRDQIIAGAGKAIASTTAKDPTHLYARLILWQFHKDQQDEPGEQSLTDLMNAVLEYAKDAQDAKPIKKAADKLLFYAERGKAKELYKLYVERIITSDIKDNELHKIALDFYKEGNLDLAEGIYDVYIERLNRAAPKETLIPVLIDIAKSFVYPECRDLVSVTSGSRSDSSQSSFIRDQDEGPKDMLYAEGVFKKIEALGGKEAFDEELIYLRAFNLEKAKEFSQAEDFYIELTKRYPKSPHADEADFKAGIISIYILRDIKTGRTYFEKLAQKETPSPQAISSLYQLGLLSQWEGDPVKAKEYYDSLLEKANPVRDIANLNNNTIVSNGTKDSFGETVELTKERLKEIQEAKPIEYNLKTFLDVSLNQDYSLLEMTNLALRSYPYLAKKDEKVNIYSAAYTPPTGCMQVELQYLWSGHIGRVRPVLNEASFDTTYIHPGTKEINLVVVSPSGIIDRSLDIVDVK